jgi:hypothetical protein
VTLTEFKVPGARVGDLAPNDDVKVGVARGLSSGTMERSFSRRSWASAAGSCLTGSCPGEAGKEGMGDGWGYRSME